MKENIELQDFERSYLPFKFKGFWKDGYCFLKILIRDGKTIFLCCQLPDYTGTSVTNAVESIVVHAAMKLEEEKTESGFPVVNYNEKFPFIKSLILGEEKHKKDNLSKLINHLFRNSVWIEHYPPNVGLAENGSYAHVVFTDDGEPIWNYISVNSLVKEFGLPEFFSVNYDELSRWNTRKS